MEIKYVGRKQQCTAFKADTGISWLPGAVHEVKDAIATKMLKHPDVFAAVAKAVEPEQNEELDDVGNPTTELTPLESMSKEQLQQLAKDKGLTVHHKSGVASLVKTIKGA